MHFGYLKSTGKIYGSLFPNLQHPAICKFSSTEFYGNRLITDESISRRHSGLNLKHFWPRGEEWPIVFCQVEGEEESGHTGSKRSAKVDSQSKYNPTEAEKIVSKPKVLPLLPCSRMCPHVEYCISYRPAC